MLVYLLVLDLFHQALVGGIMQVDSLPNRSINDTILLLRGLSTKRRIWKLVLLRGQDSLLLGAMLGQNETVVCHAIVNDTLVGRQVLRLD